MWNHLFVSICVNNRWDFLHRNWSEDDNKFFLQTLHNDIISISKKEVLKFYGMCRLCITSAYNLMNVIGMKYLNLKKNHYSYGKERKDVINSRWVFLKKYLTNNPHMYCWLKILLKELIRLNIDSGVYKYRLPENGSSVVKFHVDVHKSSQETMYLTDFGGNESLRKPKCDKIIILFGKNESIFNKDTYTSRCWSVCNIEEPLIPNSEGMGFMVSAIKYCEFGIRFRHVTDDRLIAINNLRCRSHNYVDRSASIKFNGSI